jgi:hypothetical protein
LIGVLENEENGSNVLLPAIISILFFAGHD